MTTLKLKKKKEEEKTWRNQKEILQRRCRVLAENMGDCIPSLQAYVKFQQESFTGHGCKRAAARYKTPFAAKGKKLLDQVTGDR